MNVTITVNGTRHELDVAPQRLLVEVLREELGLTGTHVGCDTAQCGACTVHLDGDAVKACVVLAAQADGAAVTTIEGIGQPSGELADLHPLQVAFRNCHGLQCGFCTPGMIMRGVDMVNQARNAGVALTAAEVRAGLEGNLCRCTGYQNIVRAVLEAADKMEASA